MTAGRSGWTVFCEKEASDVIEAMPPTLKNSVIRFFCDFAVAGGLAIDTGGSPPGRPLDDADLEFRLVVDGTSMFFDYLILADIKEFRVTNMIWLG
ncbi:hypothetical protein BKA00_003284 [Actinomadura coerulea]|uniref:Uncharacterized protein n=1 Tax=Actinomadura coerulea TaxID=46159 RepID=A0A7X0G0A8_9ACTN|nr:hypothetical protein [Actinomadura coerulea]MBB6396370.1 hypothetical protein [Actinomadura coerulea]GGQ06669.1 hypothetical protein GCM10010187_23460 [Actinomadura coerulea]